MRTTCATRRPFADGCKQGAALTRACSRPRTAAGYLARFGLHFGTRWPSFPHCVIPPVLYPILPHNRTGKRINKPWLNLSLVVGLVFMLAPPVLADFQAGRDAYGRGDYATALKEWRLLANQGHATAQFNLGLMYDYGKGVPQDYQEAAKWYRPVAEQGYTAAQNNLGSIYEHGKGVAQDYAEAMKWFRLSADQGYAAAQDNLGVMYNEGQGVPQDDQEAVRWYRLAAQQGYAKAQFHLGFMYALGHDVPQDYVLAHMWMNLAAAKGVKEAVKNRDFLEKRMTPAQLAEAQRLAREWRPKGK